MAHPQEEQEAKGQVVKEGAQEAKGHHKSADEMVLPSAGVLNIFRVHPVAGNGHLREIGEQVGEKDLLGQHHPIERYIAEGTVCSVKSLASHRGIRDLKVRCSP